MCGLVIRFSLGVVIAQALCLFPAGARADDVYVVKPVAQLQVIEGTLPKYLARRSGWMMQAPPRVALSGTGEALVAMYTPNLSEPPRFRRDEFGDEGTLHIAIRIPNARDVEGKAFLPDDQSGRTLKEFRFKIPATEFAAANRQPFLRARLRYYEDLQSRNLPGAAWFRYQTRHTAEMLGIKSGNEAGDQRGSNPLLHENIENTFALFSGGRAVSENLQLDRVLPTSKPAEETVPLDKIVGITIREFDWLPLVKDLSPTADLLATRVPADQHALFFPNFAALIQAIDLANQHGTPFLPLGESRSEHALTQDRYQRQLCLPLGEVERLLGPQLITSVALTGSDPYFRTGTDVAVLFTTKSSAALTQVLQARITQANSEFPDAAPVTGEILGVPYRGARSPNRRICSYLATLGDVVVVTNSLPQLQRLVEVHQGTESSLAREPEYRFFRDRYTLDDSHESAFLVLSDKTIRRWCGPRWRIATSRRTRSAAVLGDWQARYLDKIVNGTVQQAELPTEFWISDGDQITLAADGVSSTVYGNLDFQTPINEIAFTHVTSEEARLYERWRASYQQNWSNFFDPIAARLSAAKEKFSVDLTVMPLIDRSEYRQYINISTGAKIGTSGDPHDDSLAHIIVAINPESETLNKYAGMVSTLAPQVKVNPLSWLGNAISVYADQDPFWDEAKQAENSESFVERNYFRLPVAMRAEVTNGLKLAAFLTGVRAYIDQTAPGMAAWETLEHNETPYVKVSATPRAQGSDNTLSKMAIYYIASGESFVISFNEGVIKRAIDREVARRNASPQTPPSPAGEKWIGDNLCLRLDGQFRKLLTAVYRDEYQRAMQHSCWSNIPILNEWKQRFPDRDPVAVHELIWRRRLVCPGAGEYRWNETAQTMESTMYGHPAEPKSGPDLPSGVAEYAAARFGVTFEEFGLRARVELIRTDP